jgi:hypothetical protein
MWVGGFEPSAHIRICGDGLVEQRSSLFISPRQNFFRKYSTVLSAPPFPVRHLDRQANLASVTRAG